MLLLPLSYLVSSLLLVILGSAFTTTGTVMATSSSSSSLRRALSPTTAYDPTTPAINFQQVVDDLLLEARTTGTNSITIPPGFYRAEPPPNQSKAHLVLQNLVDFTIIANDVQLVCTKTTRAITIEDCHDLTIQGLTIDYDPLPYTQGVITGISGLVLQIRLDNQGYLDANSVRYDTADKIEIYDPNTKELSAPTYYNVQFAKVNDSTITATKPQGSGLWEQVGHVAVIKASNMEVGTSAEHAIRPMGCTNLLMDSVTLYGSNMFGFFETDCSNSVYRRCVVDRRSPSIDLYPRPLERMRSLTADAFHSKYAHIGPTYDGVLARYMGDDGIAVNGHYHLIMEADGTNVLRVIGKFGDRPNIEVGDPVELIGWNGMRWDDQGVLRMGDVIVTDIVEADLGVTDVERGFLNVQQWMPNVGPTTRQAQTAWLVTLSHSYSAVELPMGSLIASSNRIGNGFKVIGSTVGPNRSRGILIKASQGIISNNVLVDNWGQAIKASPEYFWLEAGSGSHIRIQNNKISGCRDVAIAVYATGGDGSWAPAGAHKNIVIAQNEIYDSTYPNVVISGIETLDYYGNSLGSSNNEILMPYNQYEFGRNAYKGAGATRKLYQVSVTDIVWNNSRDTISVTPKVEELPEEDPTLGPTPGPTSEPTQEPTAAPTPKPSRRPTPAPTQRMGSMGMGRGRNLSHEASGQDQERGHQLKHRGAGNISKASK